MTKTNENIQGISGDNVSAWFSRDELDVMHNLCITLGAKKGQLLREMFNLVSGNDDLLSLLAHRININDDKPRDPSKYRNKGLKKADYEKALQEASGIISEAARVLGVHRSTVVSVIGKENLYKFKPLTPEQEALKIRERKLEYQREYSRAARAKDPEKYKKVQQEKRTKDPEKYKQYREKYIAKDPEKRREKQREYNKKWREKKREYNKKWREKRLQDPDYIEKEKERLRLRYAQNAEKQREYNREHYRKTRSKITKPDESTETSGFAENRNH